MDQAFVSQLVLKTENKTLANTFILILGVLLLSLLAQITLILPWTPVPITGQTFGVALMSLLWGKKRALLTIFGYLALGASGLPVFALGKAGMSLGPTMGYLVGMLLASYVMGSLADRGWTNSFKLTWLAAFIGSLITFAMGVLVLSFFLPNQQLLMAGVLPFLPGDFIKTLLASTLAYQVSHRFK